MNDLETKDQKKIVFVLGSKGIPAKYGGFETFVENLTLNQVDKSIQYYVSCLSSSKDSKDDVCEYNGAKCFYIRTSKIGSARAVIYDWKALKWAISFIAKHKVKDVVILICACRIGPMIAMSISKIHKLGARVIINPDGHEWKRAKWNKIIKAYWKISERLCVKSADLLVCDSLSIEKYIKHKYKRYVPKTKYIAYGCNINLCIPNNDTQILEWFKKNDLKPRQYYINIARLVPENNYEAMIREFMLSNTYKKFVLVTNHKDSKYFDILKKKLGFIDDDRIVFVDAIYDQNMISTIRKNAYGYIHGHSVGGTNPSLVEALGSLDINLVYDCEFNNEVAEDGALYWNLEEGNLRRIIEIADNLKLEEIKRLGEKAHKRIQESYTWKHVCEEYEGCFEEI